MTDRMTWDEFDALECRCGHGIVEPVPGMEQSLRCTACGGWGAVHWMYLGEPDKLRQAFMHKPEAATVQ